MENKGDLLESPIWPKENPKQKPPFEKIASKEKISGKVVDYMKKSNALEVYWKKPNTGQQLQAEIERMAKQTKNPQILRELWNSLGGDPVVVAECLARPALADRLIRNWYAYDQRFHGDLRARIEKELSEFSAKK